MKISDFDQLPSQSNTTSANSELGIGIIKPNDTIADTAVEGPHGLDFQPTILPIGLAQLQEMCALDEKALKQIRIQIERFLDVHSQKTIDRRNDRDQHVYDEWGLLNPENLFVLLTLLCRVARFHKNKKLEKNEKLRILTLGTGSGLTDVAMHQVLSFFDIDFEIHTVDFRQDEDGQREEVEVTIPLDRRNKGYGPIPARGIGHEIDKARMKSSKLKNIIQHHDDSANFLKTLGQNEKLANSFHFVFVDANHLYGAVLLDLTLSRKLLTPGGVTFLDDFGGSKMATNSGVTMAAYIYAGLTGQFGYFISNPQDPFTTNTAFFVESDCTKVKGYGFDLQAFSNRDY